METIHIYLVENCYGDSNKIYIGKSINPIIRYYVHRKTYGTDIKFTIIDTIESVVKHDWVSIECYWIEQFKHWGYNVVNINNGGGGSNFMSTNNKITLANIMRNNKNMLGKKHSDATRLKMSQSAKGKILSDDIKAKISAANKGKSKPDGYKAKISAIHLGKKISLETKIKMGTAVLQYDLQGNILNEYYSASEAARSINKTPSAISECCIGIKRKSAYGYVWKYKNA
jgi:hypothetical protein